MEFLKYLNTRAFNSLDVTDHTVDLQGWVNAGFDEILQLTTEYLKDKKRVIFIEVGTWKGASISRICSHYKNNNINIDFAICVDTWLGAPEFLTWGLRDPERGASLKIENGYPSVFYTFTKNMKSLSHHDIIAPLPISSVQAAEVLRYYKILADVMYIDGSHEYKAVLSDLEEYQTLLKPGGIMWGDDFTGWPGVEKAVIEFSSKYNYVLTVKDCNWMLRAPLNC